MSEGKKKEKSGKSFIYFHLVECLVEITSNFVLSVYHCEVYFIVRMEVKCIFITTCMWPTSCVGIKDIIMLIIPEYSENAHYFFSFKKNGNVL